MNCIGNFKHKPLGDFPGTTGKRFGNFLLRPRLREEDAPGDVAWYILMNPVRAGLVSKPEQYQYSGPISSGPRMLPCSEKAWVPPGLEAKGSKTNIKQKQLT